MRCQIFRQIVQKFRRHTDVCRGIFVQDDGKYASRCGAKPQGPIQLVSIWAALGGLVSLILCLCNVDMAIQIIVFFAVTILAIILTRPLAKKMTGFRKTATNADMNIGKVGRVTKIVDEQLGIFRVRVENNDWSATTENKQVLPVDSEITVLRIEGVKLIVAPVKKTVIVKS